MKFENVKSGDILYYKKNVAYAFNTYKTFTVPTVVGKITPTGFYCSNGNFYLKTDGRSKPRGSQVYLLGDSGDYGHIIKDEVEQYSAFITAIKAVRRIRELVDKLKIRDMTFEKMSLLEAALNALEALPKQSAEERE